MSSDYQVQTVDHGKALVEAASESKPDVVVTDLRMPFLDGIEAARQILENGWCRRIVVLTMCSEPSLMHMALKTGVLGYVMKTDASDELIPAIEAALRGETYISSASMRDLRN